MLVNMLSEDIEDILLQQRQNLNKRRTKYWKLYYIVKFYFSPAKSFCHGYVQFSSRVSRVVTPIQVKRNIHDPLRVQFFLRRDNDSLSAEFMDFRYEKWC